MSTPGQYKCARSGCENGAAVLVKETEHGVQGFPLCTECEHRRQTSMALRGNAYTEINCDRIVFTY